MKVKVIAVLVVAMVFITASGLMSFPDENDHFAKPLDVDPFRFTKSIIWDFEKAKSEYNEMFCMIIILPKSTWMDDSIKLVKEGWKICFVIYDDIEGIAYLIITRKIEEE
ncbi:MAG: hypothetical protein JW984_15145 [Deltaproteobacteria bacterium]|uniref:Uncharacterized protein n=1 Tax=Candidatus Zymogenus saltonus TaxID=2844893 RepID=A0A9D8PP21_9DELT|nr:hypothetical protein [Candidatus Zymogenus saltonus]